METNTSTVASEINVSNVSEINVVTPTPYRTRLEQELKRLELAVAKTQHVEQFRELSVDVMARIRQFLPDPEHKGVIPIILDAYELYMYLFDKMSWWLEAASAEASLLRVIASLKDVSGIPPLYEADIQASLIKMRKLRRQIANQLDALQATKGVEDKFRAVRDAMFDTMDELEVAQRDCSDLLDRVTRILTSSKRTSRWISFGVFVPAVVGTGLGCCVFAALQAPSVFGCCSKLHSYLPAGVTANAAKTCVGILAVGNFIVAQAAYKVNCTHSDAQKGLEHTIARIKSVADKYGELSQELNTKMNMKN